MKWLFLLLVLSAPQVRAATPTLVQSTSDSLMNNVVITKWPKKLPNPTIAGNLLVASCTWHGSGADTTTMTISDDKGNTWIAGPRQPDATNNQALQIFYAPNVIAGTQVITPLLSGAQQLQCLFHEFFNVATSSPADGSNCNTTTSGTSVTSGSFTTTTAGNLIFYVAVVDSIAAQATPLTFTPGTGFTGLIEDGTSFFASQYEVQSAAGAINPLMTTGAAVTGAPACAIAFKSATAGSGPAVGMHVNSAVVITYPMQTSWSASTITLQFPTSGNLIVLMPEVLTNAKVTGVSSSPANTWASVTGTGLTSGCADNGASAVSECMWYAANATSSTSMTITITYGSMPAVGPITGFWDISGAATSPFDVAAGSTGNLAAQTGTVTGPSINPSTTNGIIVSGIEQDGQVTGSATPGYLLTVQSDGYQNLALDQDGGWLHYYNPNTNAVAVT